MHPKQVKVDIDHLMFAYQDDSPENAYYLDTEYGDVVLVNRELTDLRDLTDEIELSPDKFLYIPKPRSEELVKDLHIFAESVSDAKLRSVLDMAFESPHLRDAFRKILSSHSQELIRLDQFLVEKTKERLTAWLNANSLSVDLDTKSKL
jgi:hypothetical protein